MNSVDSGDKIQTRSCPHREKAHVGYVNNDGRSAPVIYVEGCEGPTVISLTNQIIRVSCPTCFSQLRAKCSL